VNLSGYHPCLAINGIYDVNVDVTITSSFIYLGPDAQIRVQTGATLTLNDCVINGCNAMWSRVMVNTGGILVADNCYVEDGIDGFDARSGSELTVKNCYFTNNYIGMYLRNKFSTVPPTGIVFAEPLSNNIFQTNGSLLPPYTNQIGFAGIKVQNVAPVIIGETGYPQNQFLNISNGVVSENSRVVVKNALFQSPPPGYAGGILGISAVGSTVDASGCTFNNCFKGIVSSACNLTATENTFSSVLSGIEITNSANRRVRITGNMLTNTRLLGVTAIDNGVFNEFLVRDNEIEMDFAPQIIPPSAAVRLESSVSVNQSNVNINENNIDLYGAAEGIQVIFNRNTAIEDNNVEIFQAAGLSAFMMHGINVSSSGNSSIMRDTVIVTSELVAAEIHTIELENSENSTVCSNFVDNSSVGFKLDGQNPNTYFGNNSINNHDIGVSVGQSTNIGIAAFIGVQGPNNKARDNQWNGTYSEWGALNGNSELLFVQQSRFNVRNTSQPQLPPSISAVGQWFFPNGTGQNYGCPVYWLTENPGDFEKSIALGTVPFTNYAVQQLWRAQTTLYRSLKENPELLGQDQDVDAFYNASASGVIGAFQTVSEGISGLGVPDELTVQEYDTLETGISAKMGELASIDAQLLTASGTVYDGLVSQRRTVSKTIDSLHMKVLELDSVMTVVKTARADQLIALNASISASTLPQQYLKSVNEVYLSTVAKGVFELTDTLTGILEPIANTCIYEGGDAVLGARILLELTGDTVEYDDDLLCSPPQALVQPGQGGNSTSDIFEHLSLIPNPAKGQVEISYPALQGQGHLNIFDHQGVLKLSVDLSDGQTSSLVSLRGFASGMYIVFVKRNDQIMTKKLVVLE
jgi:type IX secretion system substrate protein